MPTELLVAKNRAYSKLAAAISAGATTITVTAGDGANFPSTYPFHITIEDEIISCTARSTDSLTIVRAQQGTTGAAHPNKAYVALNITAKSVTDLNTAVNAIENDAVFKALFDANTILAAISDNTPAALTVAASRILGRKASGNIAAMTVAELLTLINVAAGADVTGNNAPQAHKASHQDTGGDEISVTGLSGLLADDQHVLDSEVTAVAIARSILDAHSILIAISDNTPVVLTLAASRIVGRKASGNIVALTAAEILTIINVESGATADLTGDEIVTLLEALAGAAQLSHTKISDVGATDHHTKYTDAEAVIQALAQKLDDFTTPDDNTDLDASTTKHGLFAKLLWDKLNGIEASAKDDLTGDEIVTLLEALAGVAQLSHTKISDIGVDDHHAQSHDLASHSTKAHSELSDAPEGAHHTKFTTTEHSSIGNSAPHHTKYVDASAVSAVEAAGLTFAENKGVILDALLSADEKWSGISEIGTMGYAATVGDLVYLAVADTKWELAKADVAATSKGKIGLVTVTTAENSTCQVLLYGKMRSAAFPAFTVGAPAHISAATAGDVVVAAPTGTTNFVVRIVGYGNTAEDLFFCPDNTYIELA